VAALIWWFISLEKQNIEMTALRLEKVSTTAPQYKALTQTILREKQRNSTKYLSEGITFLLLIIIGAIIVYRSFRRQMSFAAMQQNFMMAVTHELKTPIATTRLSLETLKHRQLETTQQHKLIDNAMAETSRLDVLTNNILMAAQLEEKDRLHHETIFSLTTLIQKTAAAYRQRFPNRIFQENTEDNLLMKGDEHMIQIAISNLLDNAVKYAASAGAIEVRLKKANGRLVVEVSNEGERIPDKEKKKIFQKFYRGGDEKTRKTKGTGLGLYLTEKIIHIHQGMISVRDRDPAGSTFVIELPEYVS
jgi:signal transduction histidine kinase